MLWCAVMRLRYMFCWCFWCRRLRRLRICLLFLLPLSGPLYMVYSLAYSCIDCQDQESSLLPGLPRENSYIDRLNISFYGNEQNQESKLPMNVKPPTKRTSVENLTDYNFVQDVNWVVNSMHSLVKHKLQTAMKNSWSNLTHTRRMIVQVLDDMQDIHHELHHQVNLIRIQAAVQQTDETEDLRQQSKQTLELMYRKILYFQNPPDCQKAKKLLCNINKSCGFGCQLHHAAYCLVVSYALERILVIQDREWSYAPGGWHTFFQPWSDDCKDHWGVRPEAVRADVQPWDEGSMASEFLECKMIDLLTRRPDFLPPAVPRDLGPRISAFHQQPFIWWMGQMVAFLMRPSPELRQAVETTMQDIGFWGPIVGVHIRRNDKLLKEGGYHSVKAYFKYVEEYFRRLSLRTGAEIRPRVYLSTDDSQALEEAKESYPHIDVLCVSDHVRLAESNNRYNEASLQGLLLDVFLLASTDFLVCTLSSQVCRLAYELMQTYHVDASKRVVSLDQDYYFGGQNPPVVEATMDYVPSVDKEIRLRAGDKVFVQEIFPGYFIGMNMRTNERGKVLAYTVREVMRVDEFKIYPDDI